MSCCEKCEGNNFAWDMCECHQDTRSFKLQADPTGSVWFNGAEYVPKQNRPPEGERSAKASARRNKDILPRAEWEDEFAAKFGEIPASEAGKYWIRIYDEIESFISSLLAKEREASYKAGFDKACLLYQNPPLTDPSL